ncbi:hypothetical protein KAU08_09205, partial [bacterium]|nr:hypothetical protein [bacterium]
SAIMEMLSEKGLEIPVDFVCQGFEGVKNFLEGSEIGENVYWLDKSDDGFDEFKEILRELNPYVVVTDINLTGRVDEYLEAIHPAAHISLHEFNFSILKGDKVIAPTIHPMDPAPGATLGVTHFTGAEYVLISPDIIRIRENAVSPQNPPKKVLVTMGGADPSGLTEKILGSIRALNNPNIDWVVVLGPASGQDKWKFMRDYPAHIKYLEGSEIGRAGFLAHLASSDAIITNGGTTLYETLTLGRPAIAIPQNDFEGDVINQLVELNACVTPGDVSPVKILETLNMFFDDAFARSALSENGRKLIDGLGVNRVAEMVVGMAEGTA